MNQQDIDQLYKSVYEYSVLKKQVVNNRIAIETQLANNQISGWQAEAMISELYKEVESTPEREAYIEITKRAPTDTVLEKYLRAAHSEHFLGRPLDPTKL